MFAVQTVFLLTQKDEYGLATSPLSVTIFGLSSVLDKKKIDLLPIVTSNDVSNVTTPRRAHSAQRSTCRSDRSIEEDTFSINCQSVVNRKR